MSTTVYPEAFFEKWNVILSECLLQLIKLIMSFEEAKIGQIKESKMVQEKLQKKSAISEVSW